MNVCGCNSHRPCAEAELLFQRGMSQALSRHLERTVQAFLDGKQCHRERISCSKVPKVGAKTWPTETRPLLELVRAAPRDWPALESWAAANRVDETRLRNQVAWLEEQGAIASEPQAAGVVWRASP
jgi:hypothetical protein